MEWKCPDCGIQNETLDKCSCGYSFYKVLGVKPGASPKEAEQAYRYLVNVYRTSDLTVSNKRSQDRIAKVETAYVIYRKATSSATGERGGKVPLIAAAGGIAVVLLAVVIYFLVSRKEAGVDSRTAGQPAMTAPLPAQNSEGTPAPKAGQPAQPGDKSFPQQPAPVTLGPDASDEQVIEVVKTSDALYKNTSVESIVNKWTEENSGRLNIVGWKVKKTDDGRFLVSYTALDGNATKGFYFDLDPQTGKVQNLANNPELQKKYNIKY